MKLPRVLNYHGSKYTLADWILRFAPPHEGFVDLFGGSGAFFCGKAPVPYEVYNDRGSEVVNFFRQLREQPEALARAVGLSPWSREELTLAHIAAEDPLERARRFVVRSWQSRGTAPCPQTDGDRRWKAGWRYQRENSRGGLFIEQWGRIPEAIRIFAQRMLHVQIEHDDALMVIPRFDSRSTFFVADPPYLEEQRSKWAGKAYEHELSSDDHVALADALHSVEGYALVCGYPSTLYCDLYERRGWRRYEKRVVNLAGRRVTEALWVSPRTQAALQLQIGPLFSLSLEAP